MTDKQHLTNHSKRQFVAFSAFIIAFGIAFGAFGSHSLQKIVEDQRSLQTFQTAVLYHQLMGLGLLAIGFLDNQYLDYKHFKQIWRLIFMGLCLFSGSLYLLVFAKILGVSLGLFGIITPIGGVLLLVGWCLLGFRLLKKN